MKIRATQPSVPVPLPNHSPYVCIAKAYARSWLLFRALPPGNLIALDDLERANRRLLMDRARIYGPIYKGLLENRLAIFIVDDAIGRRILKKHGGSFRPITVRLDGLFPYGHMRQMEGEIHRAYRTILVRGVNALNFDSLRPLLAKMIADSLEVFSRNPEHDSGMHAWSSALAEIANGMLVYLFFGAKPGEALFERIIAGYRKLGPYGVAWNITEKQVEAFGMLRAKLAREQHNASAPHGQSLTDQIRMSGPIDETMLGNLIYMVELGRYDLRGLLRWVSKYAADYPQWLDRVADEINESADWRGSIAEAFVLEVLRLEQSERLMRDVVEDIVFDGYMIPKDTLLRICMWENHKAEAVYPNPFAFDPSRFMRNTKERDGFSPFGLDHHRCPFAQVSIRLAMEFLKVLARNYTIKPVGGNSPIRGAYHWEPSPGFSVRLKQRMVQ
jgi:cytochrome P450